MKVSTKAEILSKAIGQVSSYWKVAEEEDDMFRFMNTIELISSISDYSSWVTVKGQQIELSRYEIDAPFASLIPYQKVAFEVTHLATYCNIAAHEAESMEQAMLPDEFKAYQYHIRSKFKKIPNLSEIKLKKVALNEVKVFETSKGVLRTDDNAYDVPTKLTIGDALFNMNEGFFSDEKEYFQTVAFKCVVDLKN
jgi:hypothetical protein